METDETEKQLPADEKAAELDLRLIEAMAGSGVTYEEMGEVYQQIDKA